MAIELQDIKLKAPSPTYNDVINSGPNILPQKIIQLYDDTEWEEFTEECAHNLKNKYKIVRRAGGAGDQGIDIAAFQTDKGFEGEWDNYQCKHYGHALRPTDVYLELGKLCYYTFKKEYSVPQNYFFVAPKGVGTSLSKLIRNNSDELKSLLISEWPKYCEKKITSKEDVPLESKLLEYVENFDFSIVKDISIVELLDIHRGTPYFHHRFGCGLPSRPSPENPPDDIAENEAIYIQKLLDAYAEFLNKKSCDMNDVKNHAALQQHMRSARVQFYCAESLYKFSRDYLEPGEFERLQDSIYYGIENIILAEHDHGYKRVVDVIQEAYKIQIDSHPLKERLELLDRAGICHQLANNNRIKWANGG